MPTIVFCLQLAMKGAENLEMEPGQSCEDNIYANIHDLKVQRMRDAPTAVDKGIGKEMSQMKNDSLPSDVQNSLGDVRDLEGVQAASIADVELSLTLCISASFSSGSQRIMELLGKVAEEVQKMKGSSNPLCSEGWRHYALSCYYLSSDSKPWNDAKKDCKNKKAHLIVINSEEEMNFLCSIAKGKLLWIGLTDQDGNWTWVDGTPYDTTPKFWGKNQPDDYKGHGFGGGEDCAALRPTNDWNDGHCSRNFPYVCEKKTPL
ncbi:asialoglycoprotein receptor 1-like [Lithobates pipiens]